MTIADQTIGLHVVSPAVVDVYENDVRRARFNYQATHSGTNVAMSARQADGRVGRFEAWSAPSGTLVYADDHASLSGWTVGYNGAQWSASGGDAVVTWIGVDDQSNVLTRAQLGATYFVLRDIDITNETSDTWIMLVANKVGTGRTDDPTAGGPGDDGYRLLIRPGPTPVGNIAAVNNMALVNATSAVSLTGWAVGAVRIG